MSNINNNIDYSKDNLLTEIGKATLKDRYMLPTEKSPQEAFARAAKAFSSNPEHAQRIYEYASNLWFMFSSPILSNGGTEKGLPISCFLNYVPDSRKGLTFHYAENPELSSNGGGIGGYWGHIRSDGIATSKGSKSTGSIGFIKVVESLILAFSQGTTRRGSYAAYQDISHPEIIEFLRLRDPSGGDPNKKALNLHNAVNLTDKFMLAVATDKDWDLIDPHTKEITNTLKARDLWKLIIEMRAKTGEPYLHFVDTTNNNQPEWHKKLGLKVHASNLCSEIVLPTNEERTAVCCLSSVNLEKYDEWKNNKQFIPDLIEFLDNVLSYFIEKTEPNETFKCARNSALNERSIGLGAMGFHAFLQSKNIPFDSPLAKSFNKKIFKEIRKQAEEKTTELGKIKGNAPDFDAVNTDKTKFRRNIHLLAVAPNATSSIICGGTSPSIEPYVANAYTHKTESGSFMIKNKYLEKLLNSKNIEPIKLDKLWLSIITNDGSVQHIDDNILSKEEKDVFKTANELPQEWIIEHAADRQPFIDQTQSVNIFMRPDEDVSYLSHIHFTAWEKGLKTLYYQRSSSIRKAESLSKTNINYEPPFKIEECLGCQG